MFGKAGDRERPAPGTSDLQTRTIGQTREPASHYTQ